MEEGKGKGVAGTTHKAQPKQDGSPEAHGRGSSHPVHLGPKTKVTGFANDQSRWLSQKKSMQETTQDEKKDEGRVPTSEVSEDESIHQDVWELEAENEVETNMNRR